MQEQLTELARLRQDAYGMGGPERVARQHASGKLTARERIALLVEPGSFMELGLLASHHSDRATMSGKRTPADGIIIGHGVVDGRTVLIGAEDFTVMGGSVGRIGLEKRARLLHLANDLMVPMVWLLDGSGGRANEWLKAGWMGGEHLLEACELSGQIPFVAAVMGPCAGDPALLASLADFCVMVKGTSMLAAGGPPIVAAAIGEQVTKEELGGSRMHCHESGVADNEAADDPDCIAQIRRYLSYFPDNALAAPEHRPYDPADDDPARAEPLLSLVPENPRTRYDMHAVVECVVDTGSIFDLQPGYGRSVITAFARLAGRAVGVVASNPMHLSGAIDGPASDKLFHFVQLCNSFNLPLIFFTDVPGVMVGSASERRGTLRRAMRVAHALNAVDVPTVSILIRKAYGMGSVAMCGEGSGQVLTLAWPTADLSPLPVNGGVQAAAGLDQRRGSTEFETEAAAYESYGGVWEAAGIFNFDDLVDPRDTRRLLVTALSRTPAWRTGRTRRAAIGGVVR